MRRDQEAVASQSHLRAPMDRPSPLIAGGAKEGGSEVLGGARGSEAHRDTISLAARLRFDASGSVVDVAPEGAEAAEAVRRDPLRTDEGSAASEGYTIQEAAVLARSSILPQRTAALRLIAAVLEAAAARGEDSPA